MVARDYASPTSVPISRIASPSPILRSGRIPRSVVLL